MAGKVAVCLSFDFDAVSLWIGGFRARSLSAISRGEFGRVGAERLLAMLHARNIVSTWFIPGHTAETYPALVKRIAEAGHEIGNHGYLHTRPANADEEEQILLRGNQALIKVTGQRPVGFRSPGAGLSFNMVSLLVKHGFLYDSSLMSDDFTPHYMRMDDRIAEDGPYHFGTEVPVVEIPFTWGLDDFPAFEYVTSRTGIQQGLASPHAVYDIWSGDFDYLYDRIGEGVFTLTMHPQVIGRGHRMLMLERLLDYIGAKSGVSFVTMSSVAAEFRANNPL